MNRFFQVALLSLLITGGAWAGPVAINLATAGNGGLTILNKNLAGNGYIPCTSGTTTNSQTCTTSNTSTNPQPAGLPTSFSNVLFNSAQVPFDIASGGANSGTGVGNTNNIWAPGNKAGNTSIAVNVGTYTTTSTGTQTSANTTGLFGVDQIWTMLNDYDASPGWQGITLQLSGFQADGVTAISETVNLVAGIDYRSIAGNTIPFSPTPCDIANIGTATLGVNCIGRTSTTGKTSATDSSATNPNYDATNASEGVTITVDNSAFTTTDTLTIPSNYWMDVQDINLGGAFLNGWLNSITITSKDGSTGVAEKAILSAITVDTVATPEPATTGLFLTGFAGLAFLYRKRSKKA